MLRQRLADIGVVKEVHKLLYYVQGWHLADTGQPLFGESIEAWANGPVVADLWHDEDKTRPAPPSRLLPGSGVAIVDYVVGRYGTLTGRDLIHQTHQEGPWTDASESPGPNPVITHDALESWFRQDEAFQANEAAVARLRGSPAYSFAPLTLTNELEAAIEQARRGEGATSRPAR